jgi:REP element-mobilizing transposase RayT
LGAGYLLARLLRNQENIIRDICRELRIDIVDMAVKVNHAHLFFKYLPKYSLSYIAQQIKGVSSKKLREQFPHPKKNGARNSYEQRLIFMICRAWTRSGRKVY